MYLNPYIIKIVVNVDTTKNAITTLAVHTLDPVITQKMELW